jgi:hypothetical protein
MPPPLSCKDRFSSAIVFFSLNVKDSGTNVENGDDGIKISVKQQFEIYEITMKNRRYKPNF